MIFSRRVWFLIIVLAATAMIISSTQLAAPVSSASFLNFGMTVDSAVPTRNTVTITTTGAQYILNRKGMELWRRIDPNTNAINPRKVATLAFNGDLGPLTIETVDNSKAVIQSSLAKFEFMSDSLFFLTAKAPFTYTHTNLIANAPWNKGTGRDRMWTDGSGGSLQARVSGGNTAVNNLDSTTMSLAANDVMAHMVFPPKVFNFNALYGPTARPFVQFLYENSDASSLIAGCNLTDPCAPLLPYIDNGFGTFVLFGANLYENFTGIPEDPELYGDVMGYQYAQKPLIQRFIAIAHRNGFKVVTYMFESSSSKWNYPARSLKAGQHQDMATTLGWMRNFQSEMNLDGWYFDNSDAGGVREDYDFIRQVRTDIGDNGIIYNHDSVDVWGSWLVSPALSGLRAVFVDAYVNYTLTGETGKIAEVDSPNHPYLRFFTSGYGLSQAFGAHKLMSNGKAAMLYNEGRRVMAENLYGTERNLDGVWLTHFKKAYEAKKAKYLTATQNGTFRPDTDWPLNSQSSWFRVPENVKIIYRDPTSATVEWITDEVSTSELSWTANGVWPANPQLRDSALVTNHRLNVTGLEALKNYEFRIRSRNNRPVPNEIVWGSISRADFEISTPTLDEIVPVETSIPTPNEIVPVAPPFTPPPSSPPVQPLPPVSGGGGGNSSGGGGGTAIINTIASATPATSTSQIIDRQALIYQLKLRLLELLKKLLALLLLLRDR